jgi:hypothetical protein
MLDLVITGGQVVTPQGVVDMDVGVQGEKIVAALGWPSSLSGGGRRVHRVSVRSRGPVPVKSRSEPHHRDSVAMAIG